MGICFDIIEDVPTFLRLSITMAALSLSTISLTLSTSYWEYHTYNSTCILSRSNSTTTALQYTDFIFVTVHSDTQDASSSLFSRHYFIHRRYAGIWELCNILSEGSQEFIYGVQNRRRCFNYLSEYPKVKSTLSANVIYFIQMRNAAVASLILDILMLMVAMVTGVIGLVKRQVFCIMITAVMFLLTAFYTLMALVVMHVKIGQENRMCSSFNPIPTNMCDCYTVHPDWSLYVAWMSAALCALTFFTWMRLAKLMANGITKT